MTSPAVAFARRIHPGSDVKVTFAAFTPKERPLLNGKPPPALVPSMDFWHGSTGAGDLDNWITTTNTALNIYLSLGITVDGWELKKGQPKKDDILGARWVWVDQDVDKKKDLDEERARILDQFQTGLGDLPVPSIIMDSGRGYWALWELDQVYPTKVIEEINRGLCKHFGADTAVADVGHVVRVPGTMNIRGGIWRPASIVDENGIKHKANAFPTIEKAATISVTLNLGTPQSVTIADDLDGFVTRKSVGWEKDLARAKSMMRGESDPESKSHGSFGFAAACYRLGIKNEVTYGILIDPEWAAGDHCREQNGRPPEAQAQKDMEAAQEEVGPLDVPEASKVSMISLGPLPSDTPPRPWVIPSLLMDGQIAMVNGKGGEGKSGFALQVGIACALNEPFAYWTPKMTRPTLIINFEDDKDEQFRRVEACCTVMGVDPRRLEGKLFLLESNSMVFVTRDEKGKIVPTPLYFAVQKLVADHDIGCIIIDPFVEAHTGLDENSNVDMKEAVVLLRKLARGRKIPVLLIHHSRKGGVAGDQDAARGGSSMVNACRVTLSLERMSDEAHKKIKPPRPKEFYVRVSDAKQNYAARAADRWLEMEVVHLANGIDTAVAFRGVILDNFEDGFDAEGWEHCNILLGLVERGRPNGKGPWSASTSGPKGNRLNQALIDALGVTGSFANEVIKAFDEAGMIEKGTVTKNGRATDIWVIAQKEDPKELDL